MKQPQTARKSIISTAKVETVVKDADGFIRLYIEPMGAVRLSSSDRWSKRPRAQKYFDWKNRFKTLILVSGDLRNVISKIEDCGRIHIETIHELPRSWSNKKKLAHYGEPMRTKPDADNCLKAICDVLFKEDKSIHTALISQRWCKENENNGIVIKQLNN